MGLDTSHDAFHGAYSAFNRFRQVICRAIGGSFPPHWQYNEDGSLKSGSDGHLIYNRELDNKLIYFGRDLDEGSGIYAFLTHSDCDGGISPEVCTKIADEMELLLPKIDALKDQGGGHIAARGGFSEVTRKFIAGCRLASEAGETLEFY